MNWMNWMNRMNWMNWIKIGLVFVVGGGQRSIVTVNEVGVGNGAGNVFIGAGTLANDCFGSIRFSSWRRGRIVLFCSVLPC